jgi:predicted nucleotidyltransferase
LSDQTHKPDLQRFGVASIAVFGSVARDEAGPASDIDILVEFAGLEHPAPGAAVRQKR